MSRSTGTDIIVIAALLLCTSSLLINRHILRTEIIIPGVELSHYITSDQAVGGSSEAVDRTGEKAFSVEYSLKDATSNPYIGLGLSLDGHSIDWFDSVVVRARTIGPESGHYRLYLKNVDPSAAADDWARQRQNESNFETSGEFRDIVIPRESFKVPTWWLESYGMTALESIPRFDNVVEVTVTTGALSRSETAVLEIESITLQGLWIPMLQLYRILLGLWVAGILFLTLRRNALAVRRMWISRHRMERVRDINRSLSREKRQMARIAYTDALTGILNRAGINERITEIQENRDLHGIPFTIILFDVDDFKIINDVRGHAGGDRALAALAGIVGDRIRDTDLLCRWGGEEFVVIGSNTTIEKGVQLAEKLRDSIANSDLGFTCSFGVAEQREEDFEGMFQAADEALYRAKHKGKNTVVSAG